MLRETLTVWALLTVAAVLEAGGDALVRLGLRSSRWALVGGSLALVCYGFLVNLTRWDFGRLMGVYIALFFVVAQLIALVAFREKLQIPVLVGGGLIMAGGLVLTFWQIPGK